MHDANWWLMGLSFLLGLLLTLAMMIRRVTREVPVSHAVSARLPEVKRPVGAAGPAAAGAAAKLRATADKVDRKVERVEQKVTRHAEEIEHVLEQEPYGAGSIRVSKRSAAPAGYTIKGDKDTGRYFAPDSPDYAAIEAEVWFADEESARKAGFLRWDATGDRAATLAPAAAEAVITEHHVEAETIIKEVHSAGDDSLVVVESGSPAADSAARFTAVAEPSETPFGTGSARAGADGSGPAGWLIKGNADSMLYHGPDSPAYEQTIAEVWFADEATAKAAGFARWDTNLT